MAPPPVRRQPTKCGWCFGPIGSIVGHDCHRFRDPKSPCSCECKPEDAIPRTIVGYFDGTEQPEPTNVSEGVTAMAQQVNIILTSDLTGEPASETIVFGLDGTSYEIDLTEAEAGKFRGFLAEYVGHARKTGVRGKVSGRTRPAPGTRTGPEPRDVREWAGTTAGKAALKSLKIDGLSERGRIPASVVEAYETAKGGKVKATA